MRFDLARSTLAGLCISAFVSAGCAASTPAEEESSATTDPIVDLSQSRVKRQAVGNCWLYAVASWAESISKQATGEELNMSESYWTYWHWFDQIANGGADTEISTGGHYSTGVEIISRYGIMSEAAFIPADANEERSTIQKAALDKINESLKTGALSTPEARSDRAVVRRELDAAFQLSADVIAQMNQAFGERVVRTLDRSNVDLRGTKIQRSKEIKVQVPDPRSHQPIVVTLADAIGKRGQSSWSPRTGPYAWRQTSYGWDANQRRRTLQRLQRAMHDKMPVIMIWYVDFAARDQGRFLAPPTTPGKQGGHMVVVDDYQINDVPGFGTLQAGVEETRPEALAAALSPSANIEFIRIKNSWGTHQPDPFTIGLGYNDLYMAYLNGPIKQCTQKDGVSTDECWDTTPLEDFVLPPGY